MNESILERIQSSAKALKIDLYTAELASYADEKELTPEALEAVCGVFEYLEQKKYDSMVHTMLKLSKLPMNEPKTFERFDFSRLHGKHVQSLKNLSSLSALYAGENRLTLTGIRPFVQVGDNESSKYRLSVLNELKNRGVKNILIPCEDGLTRILKTITCLANRCNRTVRVLRLRKRKRQIKQCIEK